MFSPDDEEELIVGRSTVLSIVRIGPAPDLEAYPGDLVATPDDVEKSSNPGSGYFAWAFPDSAILSFRRSAGVHYVIENLTLRGNSNQGEETTFRNATFGVNHVNCAFTEHELSRLYVAYVDTAYGILSGGAGNGELTQFNRLFTADTFRGFYCNNPQSFLVNLTDWYLGLDEDGLYLDFAESNLPGVGVNLYNCHATFGGADETDGQGTLVRIRRGTGIVQWTGGRVEHLGTLLNYDSVGANGLNDNLDVVLRGVEFEGLLGARLVSEEYVPQYLVLGLDTETGSATQYGLLVDRCRFKPQSGGTITQAQATVRFTAPSGDRLRCVFDQCRFEGIVGFATEGVSPEFVRCWRSDFEAPGSTEGALRQFSQDSGTPGARTQSVRTVFQDTPFSQTGPRINILRASDFAVQGAESTDPDELVEISTGAYPWVLEGGVTAGEFVFGKWGAFDDANIDLSPIAFYMALQGGSTPQRIYNDLTAFTLEEPGVKIATYQCLCRVQGRVRFSLVNSDANDPVYDSVTIESPSAFTDLTLVTLRAQLVADGGPEYFRVLIENLSTGTSTTDYARLKVLSQQAWGGRENDPGSGDFPLSLALANSTLVSTPDDAPTKNTYPWSVNALSVMAQSRFRLPAKPKRFGWEQRGLIGTTSADLLNGDTYYDEDHKAMNMVMDTDQMFCVHQPERIRSVNATFTWTVGDSKNIVVSGNTSAIDVNLEDDDTVVPDGTVVRIYRNAAFTSGVTVKAGSGGGALSSAVDAGKMSEFVFVGGQWRSTVLDVAFAAQT